MKILMSNELRKRISMVLSDEMIREIETTDYAVDFNYLDIASHDKTKVSYIKEDRFERFKVVFEWIPMEYDYWNVDLRKKFANMSSITKVFSKFITNNKILTSLSAIMNGENAEYEFVLLKGEDIRKYYLNTNSEPNSGSLNSSCMQHDYCQPYFDMYVEEPSISMLVRMNKDTKKITARALVWDVVENKTNSTYKFMDRIYGNETEVEMFLLYAKSNGWLRREHQQYSDCASIFSDNDLLLGFTFVIKLKRRYEYFPYMDTVKNLNVETLEISNRQLNNNFKLDNTDGSPYWENGDCCSCNDCGDDIYEGEGYQTIYGYTICDRCRDDYCWVYDDLYSTDDDRITYCEHDGYWILCADCDRGNCQRVIDGGDCSFYEPE